MKRKQLVVALMIMVFMVTSCSWLGLKSWTDRTPKEKSLAFMQFYNAQYRDTFSMLTNPASTPDQKAIAIKKKALLVKLYPLIMTYDSLLVEGKIPPIDLENTILNLINQLGGQL